MHKSNDNNDKEKEKNRDYFLRDLTPEEYSKIRFRTSVEYLELINEFRKLGKDLQKVESDRPNAMYQGLRRTIRNHGIKDITVKCLNRGVVLAKGEYLKQSH